MVRKISFAILALAIFLTGVIAFRKLNYWESSIWIFKLNPDQLTEVRSGHGRGYGRGRGEFRDERRPDRVEGFEGRQRPAERSERFPARDLPDSIRERFAGRGRGPGMRNRNFPDSLSRELPSELRERSERFSSDEGFRSHGGGGRRDFRGGRKINLGNVLWFLAAFAAFTVTAIYADKFLRLFRKGKKTDECT